MKIASKCPSCVEDRDFNSAENYFFNVNEDRSHAMTCQNGHSYAAVITNEKHEVLFQMGLYAFIDEYYRESVVNFASAYEESMKVLVLIHLVSSGISFSDAQIILKELKSTENSKGAYIHAHSILEGRAPTLMDNNSVKFRNDVVHKGLIPTESQAENYGNKVLDFCLGLQSVIQQRFVHQLMNIQHDEREHRYALLPPKAHLCLQTLDTAINFTIQRPKPLLTTVRDCLTYIGNAHPNSASGSYSFRCRRA